MNVMESYKCHPAAEIFPIMGDPELADLAEDIRKNGLLEPIITLNGAVLDGRNRLAACRLAGAEPKFTEVQTDSPTLFVISKNLHRRHLTTSQRAAIAAEIMPLLAEEAKERQKEGGRHGGELAGQGRPKNDRVVDMCPQPYSRNKSNQLRNPQEQKPEDLSGRARDIAARAVGVSGRTVQRAANVKKADPQEFERIKRGEITAERAYRKSVEGEPERTKRQQILENSAKRKMIDILSQVRGLCRGLAEMNMPALLTACEAEELRTWRRSALESSKGLRTFASKLRTSHESA